MTVILTKLDQLWGRHGSFSSTSFSRALGRNANLPTFDDFRLPLGVLGVLYFYLLLSGTTPNAKLSNFDDFRLTLGGSWGPLVRSSPPGYQPVSPTLLFKSAVQSLGRGFPLTGGGGTVESLTNKFLLIAIPRISEEYFQRSLRFNENKIIYGSGLYLPLPLKQRT